MSTVSARQWYLLSFLTISVLQTEKCPALTTVKMVCSVSFKVLPVNRTEALHIHLVVSQ